MKKVHAVVIPFPGQSHVTPMMLFSKLLAIHGFHISFLISHSLHQRILQAQADAGVALPHQLGFDIDLVPLSDGFPSSCVGNLANVRLLVECTHTTFRQNVQDWLCKLRDQKSMPAVTCLIGHHLFWWIYDLGRQFDVPVASFWTTSATVFAVESHIPTLQKDGIFPFKGGEEEEQEQQLICNIPGVQPLKPCDFPSFLYELREDDEARNEKKGSLNRFFFQQFMRSFDRLSEARWLFANTFYELESETIDAMNKIHNESPLFSAIGPLLPSALLGEANEDTRAGTSLLPEADCLTWLDNQKPSSVIYIASGSLVKLSAAQLEELAMGLQASDQPFLWVIRPNFLEEEQTDGSSTAKAQDFLPESFWEGTKQHGLVVPWAPQSLVLSHTSVGGFLSHCGWNSCIESICLGVPVLACPGFAEQKLNARCIVDVWKMGMELKGGPKGVVGREEVEKMIRRLMGETGREVRENAKGWKEKAMEALRGSSCMNLMKFVEEMKGRANESNH